MPTYEYKCEICENLWEEEQKINDPPLKKCPKCNKKKAKRLISGGVLFQLLGGGWASEGYKSNK